MNISEIKPQNAPSAAYRSGLADSLRREFSLDLPTAPLFTLLTGSPTDRFTVDTDTPTGSLVCSYGLAADGTVTLLHEDAIPFDRIAV